MGQHVSLILLSALLVLSACVQASMEEAVPDAAAQHPTGSARQFDFWIGEWEVQNRHLSAKGEWQDGTKTRARITPVIDGGAILEQWAGPLWGTFMNGFSLRSFDPKENLWTILLFWTHDGNAGFGTMQGRFRHGRGSFTTPLDPTPGEGDVTRFTFSDTLAQSIRWDQAQSNDGGISWKTNWIMEFSRTAPAEDVTEERLFTIPWNAGELSPHPEARELDWMLGSWSGTETLAGYKGARETKMDCTLLDKDCLVLTQVASRGFGEEDWDKSLQVRGYVGPSKHWESWSVSESDPVMRQAIGSQANKIWSFTSTIKDGDKEYQLREKLQRIGDDKMRWSIYRKDAEDAEERRLLQREFSRIP